MLGVPNMDAFRRLHRLVDSLEVFRPVDEDDVASIADGLAILIRERRATEDQARDTFSR